VKRLLLLRHAKAEAHTAQAGDHARGLAARGRTASGEMGVYLTSHGPVPDLILCSDARRARETLDGLLVTLKGRPKTEIEPALYLAESAALLTRLRKVNDRFETVMIIGHNPGLEDLAKDLMAASAAGPAYARMTAKFPTAALAVLAFEAESWAFVDHGGASLETFVVPRDLAET